MALDVQLISAVVFFLLLSLFLYHKRHKVTIQKIAFPFLYVIMYKAKWGIKEMELLAKKYPKTLDVISKIGVAVGFIGMIIIITSLIYNIVQILTSDVAAGAAIVQPFVKTEPGSMFFYVPFFYFIVSIFIIATIHEFAHGVLAKLYKVKVKSSGFAFMSILFPVIPMAFVEPDEKQLKKIKPLHELGIYAAGPVSNLFLALVIFLLLTFAVGPFMDATTDQSVVIIGYAGENGTQYPAELAGVGLEEEIISVNGEEITQTPDFILAMQGKTPGQEVSLVTNVSTYDVTLTASPSNDKEGYLGVYVNQRSEFTDSFKQKFGFLVNPILWFNELLLWLFILNIGIGLINLAPLGPIDGGRMIMTVLRTKYKEERAKRIWGNISLLTLILLLGNVFLPSILRLF